MDFVEFCRQVEIDLLGSLCDHPHIVHFQGAQIFARGRDTSLAIVQ